MKLKKNKCVNRKLKKINFLFVQIEADAVPDLFVLLTWSGSRSDRTNKGCMIRKMHGGDELWNENCGGTWAVLSKHWCVCVCVFKCYFATSGLPSIVPFRQSGISAFGPVHAQSERRVQFVLVCHRFVRRSSWIEPISSRTTVYSGNRICD